ncbi:MAG: hypothetical protein LBP74_03190 [Treponema sp.]|jgi:hypothetical protein|nr:hypothetical protein [Treponema sp.]
MKKRNAKRGYRDFMRIVYKKKGQESKRRRARAKAFTLRYRKGKQGPISKNLMKS